MADILRFSMPGKPEYVQTARLAVGALACQQMFDVDQVEDIKLAVSEACKLISCHGNDMLPDQFSLTVEMIPDALQITVTDEGCHRCVGKEGKRCLNCPEDGNIALLVMKSLMDDIRVQRSEIGKTIIMVKSR